MLKEFFVIMVILKIYKEKYTMNLELRDVTVGLRFLQVEQSAKWNLQIGSYIPNFFYNAIYN